MTSLRTPNDSDWSAILELANAALPWDASGNREWVTNRRRFDGQRRHYLAQEELSGKAIGYGAVEEGPEPSNYRLFLVMDPSYLSTGPGAFLYDRLAADLAELDAKGVWAREYSSDDALVTFLIKRGFVEQERFTLAGHEEMVVMVGSPQRY